MNKRRLPPQKAKKAFLTALSNCGSVTKAITDIGYDFATFYKWRHADPEFSAAWESALESALDRIEAEIHTRHSMTDPKTAKWLLSRRRPEKYGEKAEETRPQQDIKVEISLQEDPPTQAPQAGQP